MDRNKINSLIIDRPEDSIFKIHADAFRSDEIFELEMKYIFEGGWMFVGLDCQAPNPHDYFTVKLGRQPIIISRDSKGQLHCLINSCRHRGALVCHHTSGNARAHVCPYHAWTYNSAGENVGITEREAGGYTPAFDEVDHGLRRVAKFGSYRGFLFASLNADVPSLEDHLGDASLFIDMVVDQSSDGIELVPGIANYTYDGNWKMQIENSADVYHFMPTHQSFLKILNSRANNTAAADSPYRNRNVDGVRRGSFCFKYGHNAMWGGGDKVEARPLYLSREAVEKRVGAKRLKWMLYTRNVTYFPNMQLLENASLQIRVNSPISANRTEIRTYCIAPKGESVEARRLRIRQYEEFFNASGLATPDDTAIFEDMQVGASSGAVDWHLGYMRGLANVTTVPIADAEELEISPETSTVGIFGLGDETIFHGPLREWRRRLLAGIGAESKPDGLSERLTE